MILLAHASRSQDSCSSSHLQQLSEAWSSFLHEADRFFVPFSKQVARDHFQNVIISMVDLHWYILDSTSLNQKKKKMGEWVGRRITFCLAEDSVSLTHFPLPDSYFFSGLNSDIISCWRSFLFSFSFFNDLFFFFSFWLCWVFVAACRLSLFAASGVYSSLRCVGFSLQWLLLLRSIGSRCVGSVVVVHGFSCSVACEIFLDQGSNPCPLHWQADS